MTFLSFLVPPLLSNTDFPLAGGGAGEALIGWKAVMDSRRAAAPSRSPARPLLGERTCAIRGSLVMPAEREAAAPAYCPIASDRERRRRLGRPDCKEGRGDGRAGQEGAAAALGPA